MQSIASKQRNKDSEVPQKSSHLNLTQKRSRIPKQGLRITNRYSETFKATEVKLVNLKGVLKHDVAELSDVHPFMLSRWIKDVRNQVVCELLPLPGGIV
jgi:hypothetical protein